MVLETKILLPAGMEARSTIRVKKSKYGQRVFHQLLQIFEDEKIPMEERETHLVSRGSACGSDE